MLMMEINHEQDLVRTRLKQVAGTFVYPMLWDELSITQGFPYPTKG